MTPYLNGNLYRMWPRWKVLKKGKRRATLPENVWRDSVDLPRFKPRWKKVRKERSRPSTFDTCHSSPVVLGKVVAWMGKRFWSHAWKKTEYCCKTWPNLNLQFNLMVENLLIEDSPIIFNWRGSEFVFFTIPKFKHHY